MHSPQQELQSTTFQAFRSLRTSAAESVTHQLAMQARGSCASVDHFPWDRCRDELSTLLQFLEPSVEFGLLQPASDYLDWSTWRSSPRAIKPGQIAQVLRSLEDYFRHTMGSPQGIHVAELLDAVHAVFCSSRLQRDHPQAPAPGWPETPEFRDALVDGRQERALQVMNRCLDAGRGLVAFELNVVQPAMIDVGRRWQQDGLSVAVEQGAAVISRAVMTAGLARSSASPANGRSVLLACVEGNDHDLGLHMVADACRLAGWQVQCLGANVPTPDLVQVAERMRPDVLGLSIAFAHQLRMVRNVAVDLGAATGHPLPVILAGGTAAVRYERLVRSLGADAVATDSMDALAVASRLVANARPPTARGL